VSKSAVENEEHPDEEEELECPEVFFSSDGGDTGEAHAVRP
jgi:hypothetical protein